MANQSPDTGPAGISVADDMEMIRQVRITESRIERNMSGSLYYLMSTEHAGDFRGISNLVKKMGNVKGEICTILNAEF